MSRLLELETHLLLAFTARLSTLDYRKLTQPDLDAIYKFIDSDGCSSVPDFYLDACTVHDWYFRTHRNFDGTPITEAEANKRFRKLIQKKSWLGWFSPMSWERWVGVTWFGKKAWQGK